MIPKVSGPALVLARPVLVLARAGALAAVRREQPLAAAERKREPAHFDCIQAKTTSLPELVRR